MRVAVPLLALTAAVSSASASLLARQSLPNCAVPCLANANTGSCSPQDDTCLCNNKAFINSTTTCIMASCTGSDLANAEAFAQQLCLAVGVTLTAPAPASTPAGASGSAAPAPASASASPTPAAKSGAAMTGTFSLLAAAVAALAAAAVL